MNRSRGMKLVVLVLSLLVCLPALALAQSGGNGGNGGNGGSGSVNGRGGNATFRANNPMPVLIYTVWGLGSGDGSGSGSGSGGAGVTSGSDVSTLVVYDNGLATWSQSNADGSNTSGCSGNCLDTVQISTSDVNQLVQQLRGSRGFNRASNNNNGTSSSTSLSTVTIFNYVQGSTSVARTFSFYNDSTSAQALGIQNAFSGFFSSNFGSSSINGNGGSGSGGSGGGSGG
jgi:hypothetical protein